MTGPSSRAVVGALAVGAVLFALPIFGVPDGFVSGDAWRENDWLNTRLFDLLARDAILKEGVFPLRSPLVGGGFPTVAHPSDGSWAPTMLVVLAFGVVLGTKLLLVGFLFLGALGVFLLARDVLGLEPGAAGVAGGLMLVSGWAPSMILVGFWNQVFSLLGPLVLWCLLHPSPRRLLLGGLLLAMVLQQGGHGFTALCMGLGVAAVGAAGLDARRGPSMALGVLLTLAPLAIASRGDLPWVAPLGLAGVWLLARTADGRSALLRRLGHLAVVLGTAASLGAARLAGLLYLDREGAHYQHSLSLHDALWFPERPFPSLLPPSTAPRGTPEFRGGAFYDSPGTLLDGLLHRVPSAMPYRIEFGRPGSPMEFEYIWLGLSWVGLLLAATGLLVAARERRWSLLAAAGLALAVCFGPYLPPDLHFLLTGGLPGLADLAQPVKYWNGFLLLGAVLLAGVGAAPLLRRAPWTLALLALALLIPAIQNRAALGEAFAHPRAALPPASTYAQRGLLADLSQVALVRSHIDAVVEGERLREYRRAPGATGFDLARAGIGLISWYGTLRLDERAIPDVWVTPDGDTAPNPRALGPVSVRGDGEVLDWSIGINDLRATVRAPAGSVVVFDQEALGGVRDWRARGGVLGVERGLLTVRTLDEPVADITVSYRPPLLLAGLALSGLALFAWIVSWVRMGAPRNHPPPPGAPPSDATPPPRLDPPPRPDGGVSGRVPARADDRRA
jgi:hypothetical protein